MLVRVSYREIEWSYTICESEREITDAGISNWILEEIGKKLEPWEVRVCQKTFDLCSANRDGSLAGRRLCRQGCRWGLEVRKLRRRRSSNEFRIWRKEGNESGSSSSTLQLHRSPPISLAVSENTILLTVQMYTIWTHKWWWVQKWWHLINGGYFIF